MSFRPISIELTQSLGSEYCKKNGIFFTPKSIREILIQSEPLIKHSDTILEPSMGSGEFVLDLLSQYPDTISITGVEFSKPIFENVQPIFSSNSNINMIQSDFLEHNFDSQRFDQIIGNPPYYQITTDKDKYRKRYSVLGGKFDIYILFILKSLELLKLGGVLKFVIPSSFLSTDSYEPIRRYIATHFTIRHLFDFSQESNDFKKVRTTQKTIGLVIENSKNISDNNEKFCLRLFDGQSDIYYFHTPGSIQRLKNIIQESKDQSIGKSGFQIKTGEVVWNTVKDCLTSDSSHALLIHNSYLKDNQLFIPKNQTNRPLYIDYDNQYHITEPVILVNRGNGNNGNMRIVFVYFDPSTQPRPAIAENHIYKIYDNGKNQLQLLFQSLCDLRTNEFIQTCIGSGFITKKFIQLIPIFKQLNPNV